MEGTSCPEARYGHFGQRYPCPAHQHCDGSLEIGIIKNLHCIFLHCFKGCGSKENDVLQNTGAICVFIRPPVCPFIHPPIYPEPYNSPELGVYGWMNRRMDGQKDRWMDAQIPLYSTGHRPLWGCCPKKERRKMANFDDGSLGIEGTERRLEGGGEQKYGP